MEIRYSPRFKRAYQALPQHIQENFDQLIVLFIDNPKDPCLKTHKLRGQLEQCFAFDLRDGYRVLFEYAEKNVINLLAVGPHDHYRRW